MANFQPSNIISFQGMEHDGVFFEGYEHKEAWMEVDGELACVWRKSQDVIKGFRFLYSSSVVGTTGDPRFYAKGDFVIDWGNGTVDDCSFTEMTAVNPPILSGNHTVTISGNLENVSFSACAGLIKVLSPFPETMSKITSVGSKFENCIHLEGIPEDLLSNCEELTYFGYCFRGCRQLTQIPEKLFEKQIKADNFTYCFAGSGIQEIPVDIFANCPQVKNFDSTFAGCPELRTIPAALFSACLSVTNFRWCFAECSNITGLLPALWLRSNVTSYYQCFHQCTSAINYNIVPDGWK